MANNTALANNLINSTKTKSTKGKTVRGYAALNEMGRRNSQALQRDLDNIKKQLAQATTPKQRKVAKVKLYINYTMHALMLTPFLFFVGFAATSLI